MSGISGGRMALFEYDDDIIRKMQLVELEMLKELDRICRKHSIRYIIDAGTLLGAVRHQGFIPWDDDVDVKMLRSEYERFCDVCRGELGSKYFLQTHQTDPGYPWEYARILKEGTLFVREGHQCMTSRNGIFIDIFPCDEMPSNMLKRKFLDFVSLCCRKMLYSEVGAFSADTIYKKVGFSFLNLWPKSWAHSGFAMIIRECKKEKSGFVRCYAWGSKEETRGQAKVYFEEIKDISFENILVMAPTHSEELLRLCFGDYMKLPPEEERKPKHPALMIDFNEESKVDFL